MVASYRNAEGAGSISVYVNFVKFGQLFKNVCVLQISNRGFYFYGGETQLEGRARKFLGHVAGLGGRYTFQIGRAHV